LLLSTRSIGPNAPCSSRGSRRVRTIRPSAAAATPAVAAARRRPARRSASAAHGAARATCGVKDSRGTTVASVRRTRSADATRATVHAASPPATAQEMLVTFDPKAATFTPYGVDPAGGDEGGDGEARPAFG